MKLEKLVIGKWYFSTLVLSYTVDKIREGNYLYDDDSEKITIRVTR